MRIRTRYKLFKTLAAIAVVVFLASLYDMFFNDAAWFLYIFIAYAALAVLALLLYLGYKPKLDEEPTPEPAAEPEALGEPLAPAAAMEDVAEVTEVVEVPKNRNVASAPVRGPHHFRCPHCSNVFAFEATHLHPSGDFRMNCPYCARNIRIPQKPKVGKANLGAFAKAQPTDQATYACANCGEVVRLTAPHAELSKRLNLTVCPNCRARRMAPAVPA